MTAFHPFKMPARLLRDFSGQVAISLTASAVAAAFFALPQGLLPRVDSPEPVAASLSWPVPLTRDGKFAARHDAQLEQIRFDPVSGPTIPAVMAMPLSLDWSRAVPVTDSVVAQANRVAAPAQRNAQADPASVRRPVATERIRTEQPRSEQPRLETARIELVGAPLVILPAVLAEESEQPRPPGFIGKTVTGPVARATGLVGGAVGVVGAAGSWTVAQATSLLPRW